MHKFAIDLRHLSSSHPTGKAIYTKHLLNHLLETGEVYALANSIQSKYTHKNLINKKFSKIFFHFSSAFFILKNNLTLFSSESYITPLVVSLLGGKSIITVHDLIAFETDNHKFFPTLIEKVCLPLLVKFSNNSFLFSTNSQLEDFKKRFEVKSKNLHVFFPGSKEKVKKNFKKHKKYITFNSTFIERKNQLILLKAFNLIKDSIDKKLILVGKFTSPYISEIQKYILDNNLTEKVTLKDYVSHKELNEIISNTAILVNPSKIEGFGLQILESLENKIPCIVSDIPVFKEVFKNSCLYFDNSDAIDLSEKIMFLNNNLELQKQLSHNAQSILKKYNFKKTYLKFKSLLKKI